LRTHIKIAGISPMGSA